MRGALAVLLAACANPDLPARTPTEATPLTADGWGPLVVGMTRAEVVAALGPDAEPDAVGGPDPEVCDQFRPARAPAGLLVMVEEGVLTRVSVSGDSPLRTAEGLGLGAEADAVTAAHGDDAEVTPHEYLSPEGGYVTVWQTGDGEPGSRGVRYEIGLDDRVRSIHVGGPSITYVEGCA